ncbi:MAG: hypothetical protein CMD08_03690 [Flavobacteriales bacterium]|nr:hypothetical protein [Flavobacteriales bacterium]
MISPSRIAIIGCGNLGKRHIESLVKSKNPMDLFIVDNSDIAIDACLKEFKFISNQLVRIIPSDIDNLPNKLNLVIVATTSDARRLVLVDLISKKEMDYLLLEKFLFDEEIQYHEIEKLLSKNSITTWVNEWTSHEKSFIELASLFGDNKNIHMRVSGKNWRLCCNSVHFINFFDFLTNGGSLNLVSSSYDSSLYETKRKGFLELSGVIEISNSHGDMLSLESFAPEDSETTHPIYIDIKSDTGEAKCIYQADSLKIQFNNDQNSFFKELKVEYQSAMTLDVTNTILRSGESKLPDYKTAKDHHLLLFESFSDEFMKHSSNFSHKIPVT